MTEEYPRTQPDRLQMNLTQSLLKSVQKLAKESMKYVAHTYALCLSYMQYAKIGFRVEPPSKEHVGIRSFVIYRELFFINGG